MKLRMNGKPYVVMMLSFLSVFSSGCVSLGTPTRPAYDGRDAVTSAMASQLVGTWRVTDLNPLPNATPQETIIEYQSNGAVVGQVKTQAPQPAQNLTYKITGKWSLIGDTVVHSDIAMTSEKDDKISQLLSAMINSSSQKLGGQANVYEFSENRVVMVGTDGAAMEYVRLR